VAGTGSKGNSGDGGLATSAEFYYTRGVAVDASGNIYVVDSWNHRIRMVTKSTGIVNTVAGTGSGGYSGDGGLATSLKLYFPTGVAVDASGNIYIADNNNNRIRMVTKSTGIMSTVAGIGSIGYSGDGGPATSAALTFPSGVALDTSGNIYIADNNNNCIRMVTVSTGNISTVAGTGSEGYSGDGGLATSAMFNYPYGVAVDASGNIYISDTRNHRVRMVTKSTGIVTTLAGTGSGSYSGDGGVATSVKLYLPSGVAIDASGNIYIADNSNNRVRLLTMSTGIISTVAGSGLDGYRGDGGPATSAAMNHPYGVAVDASGNIYIADNNNNCIRMVTSPSSSTAPPLPSSIVTSIPTYSPTLSSIVTSRPPMTSIGMF
jgi:trimeric autotransporter adhesin